MDTQKIKEKIDSELALRSKKVLNKNAFAALFSAFTDPVGALGKIFIGRQEALDKEQQKISIDVIIDLLCKIDDAISQAGTFATSQGVVINGLIETVAHGAEEVTGVHIADGSGPVSFKGGTVIRTTATSTKNVTGLKIGG
jgi:hypothetical protein